MDRRPDSQRTHAFAQRHRAMAALVALLVWTALPSRPARAQDPPDAARQPVAAPQPAADGGNDLAKQRQELDTLRTSLTEAAEDKRKLEADLEGVRSDRARLSAALIDTSRKVSDAEAAASDIESRLETMKGSEDAIRASLESRRGVLAQVLASLQRLGRKPPPAILVRPQDVLQTIRTSMMLGAVVPSLRGEAEALASDLDELTRLRQQIGDQRAALRQKLADLGQERTRLDAMVAERQAQQAKTEADLSAQSGRAADLAHKASSVQDLIARLEEGVAASRKAADAARAAEDMQRKAAEADANSVAAKVAAGPFRDPARLQPAVPFVETKGLLPFPAAGRLVKTFGQPDGFGSTEKGLSLATHAKAVVVSPADGWVAFSGPYRTYGQVVIMNMGGGYYIVLAGMDHVDVALGQFVLSGEPLATMGDGSVKTAAAIGLGGVDPILYVEIRKDGSAIDPSSWWAKAAMEKVRG